jgi:hypothetical protein
VTTATAGLRPRRARTTTYSRIPSPVVVPVLTGPYGTGILDTFETTANQNLTGRAGWGGTFVNGDTSMKTDGQPHNAVGTQLQSNWWGAFNGPDFVRDQEGWAQLAAYDQTFDQTYIGSRITGTGASFTFYCVLLDTTSQWRLVKFVSAALTVLDTKVQRVTEGDAVATAVRGTTVEGWYCPNGGAWTKLSTVNDVSIKNNGGPLAMICRAGAGRSLSFSTVGGGNLSAYHNIVPSYRRVWAGRS